MDPCDLSAYFPNTLSRRDEGAEEEKHEKQGRGQQAGQRGEVGDDQARPVHEMRQYSRLFDCILGFPGEGPSGRMRKDWKVVFANITAWQSLLDELGRKEGLMGGADLICIQEHHLVGEDQIGKAQDAAKKPGWVFDGTSAMW